MKRRNFLKASALATVGALANCSRQEKNRPNILLIFTDQQTYRAMSCAGNSYLSTPAMDRLAAEGVRFENAYCTSPVCGPARGSLVTGLMPHSNGVEWNDGSSLNSDAPNMGRIFQANGYRAVWAGKWHLSESYPLRTGAKQKDIDGFDILPFYDSSKNWPEWGYGDVTDGPLADAVVDFLHQPQEKPFLLSVSFCNPHDCCYLTRRPERYPSYDEIDDLPPLPHNFEIDPEEPEFYRQKRAMDHYGDELLLSKNWQEPEWRGYLWNYYRMTERVDAEIGRVLQALDDSGLADNTLVLFTSDHGDGVASHRWTAKLSLYDESARIPFIVRWPGKVPAGQVKTNLVSQLDVLPTFCDVAGILLLSEFQGKSLRPIMRNPRTTWRDYVVTELADDNMDKSRKGRMLRTARYKYNVFSTGARNEQLFDLVNDPGEMHNLAYEAGMREIIQAHRRMLNEWMSLTDDKWD
jgi:arylsulfatase A-like enzyme